MLSLVLNTHCLFSVRSEIDDFSGKMYLPAFLNVKKNQFIGNQISYFILIYKMAFIHYLVFNQLNKFNTWKNGTNSVMTGGKVNARRNLSVWILKVQKGHFTNLSLLKKHFQKTKEWS